MLKLLWKKRKKDCYTEETELAQTGISGKGDKLCMVGGEGELGRMQQVRAERRGTVVKGPLRS